MKRTTQWCTLMAAQTLLATAAACSGQSAGLGGAAVPLDAPSIIESPGQAADVPAAGVSVTMTDGVSLTAEGATLPAPQDVVSDSPTAQPEGLVHTQQPMTDSIDAHEAGAASGAGIEPAAVAVAQAQSAAKDAIFLTSSWTQAKVSSSAGSACTANQNVSDGAPNIGVVGNNVIDGRPSRSEMLTFPKAKGVVYCTNIYNDFSWTPTGPDGPLAGIGYQFFAKGLYATKLEIAYSILVFQNGAYYRSMPEERVPGGAAWGVYSKVNILSKDFQRIGGRATAPLRPDFCNGPVIKFGYVTSHSTPGSGPSTETASMITGIDSWEISINRGKINPDFNLSGTIPTGNTTTYNATASVTVPLPMGSDYSWVIQEVVNTCDGAVVNDTTVDNPQALRANPLVADLSKGYESKGGFKQGKMYRVDHYVWGPSCPIAVTSKCIYMATKP